MTFPRRPVHFAFLLLSASCLMLGALQCSQLFRLVSNGEVAPLTGLSLILAALCLLTGAVRSAKRRDAGGYCLVAAAALFAVGGYGVGIGNVPARWVLSGITVVSLIAALFGASLALGTGFEPGQIAKSDSSR
jgi:hypothetical protein